MQEQLMIQEIEDLYERWTKTVGDEELSIDEFFHWIGEKIEEEKNSEDDD